MKGIRKLAAIGVVVAGIGSGVPALAGQTGYDYGRGGDGYAYSHRDYRDGEHRDRDYRDRDYRAQGNGYREVGPAYYGYGPGYYSYDDRSHYGRDAAITLGGAAAGAAIGAAAGRGQGAAIGALIGGIAGAVTSAAVDQHEHRYAR